MSAPTKKLGKLSLGGNMPTTRSQAQQQSSELDPEAEPRTSSEESSDDEGAAGPASGDVLPSTRSFISGKSRIRYDIRPLSPSSRDRAVVGLTGNYEVGSCRSRHGNLDFYLADRGHVRFSAEKLSCDCTDFEKAGTNACRHIFSLMDRLYHSILEGLPPRPLPLSADGLSPHVGSMYERVRVKLEDIAEEYQWTYVSGGGSPSGASSDSGEGMEKPDKVRDILSSFKADVLPDEFCADISVGRDLTPAQCVLQEDFEGTMLRLAANDDHVYRSLREAMPAASCANIFFGKLRRKVRTLLDDFDRYASDGTRRPDRKRPPEVKTVIDELRGYVQQVKNNVESRAPHGMNDAADTLLDLLRGICDRNRDAFEYSTWGRRVPRGEDDDDRNLYFRLIRNPSPSESFVLDLFEELPSTVLAEFRKSPATRDDLANILKTIERHHAPQSFIQSLRSLIRDPGRDIGSTSGSTSATVPPAPAPAQPSGQKRRAPGSSRGGQKRPK